MARSAFILGIFLVEIFLILNDLNVTVNYVVLWIVKIKRKFDLFFKFYNQLDTFTVQFAAKQLVCKNEATRFFCV